MRLGVFLPLGGLLGHPPSWLKERSAQCAQRGVHTFLRGCLGCGGGEEGTELIKAGLVSLKLKFLIVFYFLIY